MGFEIVEKSVLAIFKKPIHPALGMADHFYLASSKTASGSLEWGPFGIELTGVIQVTAKELERVEKFIKASKYCISAHNCEHFVNYVLYGMNYSTQIHNSFKQMGALAIKILQPAKSSSANYNDAVAKQLAYRIGIQIRKNKINRANAERIEFWSLRGVNCN
jgi:hypothetical protein